MKAVKFNSCFRASGRNQNVKFMFTVRNKQVKIVGNITWLSAAPAP